MKWFAFNANPFQGCSFVYYRIPGLSLALQPWAQISERLRRISQEPEINSWVEVYVANQEPATQTR